MIKSLMLQTKVCLNINIFQMSGLKKTNIINFHPL